MSSKRLKRKDRVIEKERVFNFVNFFFESGEKDIKTATSELLRTNNKIDELGVEKKAPRLRSA